MKILVTGATGTVGNMIMNKLLEQRNEVYALSRKANPNNIPKVIKVVVGNLSSVKTFESALNEVDYLFLLMTPEGYKDMLKFTKKYD